MPNLYSRHSLLKIAILVGSGALAWFWLSRNQQKPSNPEALVVFCAAGLKTPIDSAASRFTAATGIPVALQFGGSGSLLGQLEIANAGDVFISADSGSAADAKKRNLIAEIIPVAKLTPVLAVRRGNPLRIRGLADLHREDVRTALANPEAASIGRCVRSLLGDQWEALAKKAAVMKPTVTEIASDLALGAVDAAIIWDAVVPQFSGIPVPEFSTHTENAAACVLKSARNPAHALKFCRWLSASDAGGRDFTAAGYVAVPGDQWMESPELLIYSGAVNRPVLEPLLRQFADREGVKINTVYNGCGVLCAAMKSTSAEAANQLPDAYFACDLCFIAPVAEMFPEVQILSETEIVICVPKANPHGIKTLEDLVKPGLRLGICNQKQSTLGYLTEGILRKNGLDKTIRPNVAAEVPTADFLINQMRAGGLDAAIVYQVNVIPQEEHLSAFSIKDAGGTAVQPFAIRRGSPQAFTAQRLLEFLRTQRSSFEAAGFAWRGTEGPKKSKDIKVPEWLTQ
jgi:ABC-type molybdate transport system substrate-binding protein